jgi:Cupin
MIGFFAARRASLSSRLSPNLSQGADWGKQAGDRIGLGWAQREGGPVEEVRPGDVVWFPPGLKQWHGASSTNAMTIAIQESFNGKNVEWLEKVSDNQYRR